MLVYLGLIASSVQVEQLNSQGFVVIDSFLQGRCPVADAESVSGVQGCRDICEQCLATSLPFGEGLFSTVETCWR